MNVYFGWAQGSDMPGVYVHLSGRDVDDAILKANGIIAKDMSESTIQKEKKNYHYPTIAQSWTYLQ